MSILYIHLPRRNADVSSDRRKLVDELSKSVEALFSICVIHINA